MMNILPRCIEDNFNVEQIVQIQPHTKHFFHFIEMDPAKKSIIRHNLLFSLQSLFQLHNQNSKHSSNPKHRFDKEIRRHNISAATLIARPCETREVPRRCKRTTRIGTW